MGGCVGDGERVCVGDQGREWLGGQVPAIVERAVPQGSGYQQVLTAGYWPPPWQRSPSLCCFQEYPDALVLAAGKSGCNLDVLAPRHPGAFENLKHGNSTCQIQKYWEIWSFALAPSVQEVKNEKRLRLKKSIMKLLNYQISCYGVLPSVGGTNFRPKLYVYLIVSFSSSSFLSTYHPPIY